MYYLDVETLLRILQQRKMTGHAYSSLPSRFDGLFLLCRVTVDFKEGQLMSCVIIDQNDQLIYQAFEAMQKIQRLTLQWTLQETFPQSSAHTIPAERINDHQSGGTTNPGFAHPETHPSGPPQSGFNQAGPNYSNFNRPGPYQSSFNQPGPQQPNFNQPGPYQSNFNQPGPQQPNFNQPGPPQSGFNQPGPYQSGSAYPPNQGYGYGYPSPVDLQKMRGLIPRRQRQLTFAQMQEWPRNTKNIYTLINGINTVEQMANLLSLSISDVYTVLLELQRIQLIIL